MMAGRPVNYRTKNVRKLHLKKFDLRVRKLFDLSVILKFINKDHSNYLQPPPIKQLNWL